jgi:hypothetical protein
MGIVCGSRSDGSERTGAAAAAEVTALQDREVKLCIANSLVEVRFLKRL